MQLRKRVKELETGMDGTGSGSLRTSVWKKQSDTGKVLDEMTYMVD